MIEKTKQISVAVIQPVPPSIYLIIYDLLTDPMKLLGLILLVLQVILTGIRLKKEMKVDKKE